MVNDESKHAEPEARSGRAPWRYIAAAVAVTGLFVAGLLLPVQKWLVAVLDWVESLGNWAPPVVIVLYIAATVFLLPGSALTIGTGVIFVPIYGPLLGVLYGTLTVSLASTTGACLAFLLGRTVARDWIARKVEGRPKFQAIDRAGGDKGFRIVLLTRLSPVFPFVLLNYAFGLTKVKFWKYALASWIGMLPGTVMYVYIGSTLSSLATVAAGEREKTTAEQVFFYVGLAVAVAVAVVVSRIASKAVRQAAPEIASERQAK